MTSTTSSASAWSAPSPVTEPPRSFTTTFAPWSASIDGLAPTDAVAGSGDDRDLAVEHPHLRVPSPALKTDVGVTRTRGTPVERGTARVRSDREEVGSDGWPSTRASSGSRPVHTRSPSSAGRSPRSRRAARTTTPCTTTRRAAQAAGFAGIPAPPTFTFAMQFWGAFAEDQPRGPDRRREPDAHGDGGAVRQGRARAPRRAGVRVPPAGRGRRRAARRGSASSTSTRRRPRPRR